MKKGEGVEYAPTTETEKPRLAEHHVVIHTAVGEGLEADAFGRAGAAGC